MDTCARTGGSHRPDRTDEKEGHTSRMEARDTDRHRGDSPARGVYRAGRSYAKIRSASGNVHSGIRPNGDL